MHPMMPRSSPTAKPAGIENAVSALDQQIVSLERQKQQVVKQLDDAIGRLKEQRDKLAKTAGG